jgi:hypothetical protein
MSQVVVELGDMNQIICAYIYHLTCQIRKIVANKAQIYMDSLMASLTHPRAHTYLMEMSSSWNFPAWAEPSYEGFKPSRAGAL